MLQNTKKMLQAIMVADSYTLPLHWNYDRKNIDHLISTKEIHLDQLNSGKHSSYFKDSPAGAQTHYGDQLLHLHHHVSTHTSFVLEKYVQSWKDFITSYGGYIDHSSKTTLANLAKQKPDYASKSTDFYGMLCGLPLLQIAHTNEEAEQLLISRSNMTHNNELTQSGIRWMLHLAVALSEQQDIQKALALANKTNTHTGLQKIIDTATLLAKSDEETRELIVKAGEGCSIENNLCYSIILLLRCKLDFMEILKANIIAGSDSASRAIFLAFLVAQHNDCIIPAHLISALNTSI